MRFKFAGGLDAPEWLLAEIATLSLLTSVRTKLLVKEISLRIAGTLATYEKVNKQTSGFEDVGDARAAVAALHFVVAGAATHNITPDELSAELQQLGLPRENSEAVARAFRDNVEAMSAALRSSTLRLPAWRVEGWEVSDDGELEEQESNTVVERGDDNDDDGGGGGGGGNPTVRLTLTSDGGSAPPPSLRVDEDTLRVLVAELKQVRALMDRD